MRWPFRRKGPGSAPEPVADPVSPAAGGAPEVSARPFREWASLPPLPVTVSRPAPLVMGPAPVLPALPGPRHVVGPPVEPAAGRVEGMAMVLPPRLKPSVPPPAQQSVVDVPVAPPIVHRKARPLPAEIHPLTEAVDEYVGEPRVPAEPYKAPAWLRYTPSWLEGGMPGLDAMAGMPSLPSTPDITAAPGPIMITPPSFIPADVQSRITPEPVTPPPIQEVRAPRQPEQPPTVLKRRKANLADSRRLGLGTPTSRPGHEPFVLPSQQQELLLPPSPEPPAAEPEPEPEPQVIVESVVVDEEPPPPPAEPEPGPEPPPRPPAPPVSPTRVEAGERPSPARVVQPNYRTTPLPKPPRPKTLPKAVVVTKPPAELVDALRATQRADVADVPVYRGPKVSEVAKARGARAFAAGGAVFLPDEAGPTGSPQARGLLAHELVHAVQQRTLGPKLPSPSTPEGRALEAEAVTAERWYGGEAGAAAPAPLIHAPQPQVAPAAAEVSEVDTSAMAQLAPLVPEAPAAPPASPAPSSTLHAPFDEPTRQAVGEIAETRARTVVEHWTNPALGGSGFSGGGQGSGGHGPGAAGGGHGAGGAPRSRSTTPGRRSAGGGDGFDPAARREQLIADRLALMNAGRVGEAEVTSLPPEVEEQIDEQVRHEADQHGVSMPDDEPETPLTTGQRWVRAFGGDYHESAYNPVAGFRAEVGSEESWFASKDPKEERDAAHIAADIGLMSHDQNSANWHDWMEPSADEQTQPQGDAGHKGPNRMWTQAEKQAHGRASQEEHPFNLDQLDMDDLTARLYPKLRSKMRNELLVDRERSGRLTDFR
jgi:hypothetical protein